MFHEEVPRPQDPDGRAGIRDVSLLPAYHPQQAVSGFVIALCAFFGAHVEAVIREPGPGGEKKIEARVRKGISHRKERYRRPEANPKGIVQPK